MNHKVIFAWIALVMFVIAGCGQVTQKNVLAKVNRQVITVEQFDEKLDALPPYFKSMASENKDRFLDELINEKLFYEEALRLGLHKASEVKELIQEARSKIMIAKLIDEKISKVSEVGDEQIQQYYVKNRNEFVAPTQYRASHILVSIEEKASQILERLKAGEDFAEVAKIESIDPSKGKGGDLGFFSKGQMIPSFETACMQLNVGSLSGVVKTQFGYHIIKLTDKKESSIKKLDEVKEQIRQKLLTKGRQEKLQELVSQLRLKAKIKVNKELLESK